MTVLGAFLHSIAVGGFAEVGDKSQLLAFALATRFRRPLPILAGLFVGTLASDAIGIFLGQRASELLPTEALQWVLAVAFAAIAAWLLVKEDWLDGVNIVVQKSGLFFTAAVSSLVAEFGDRTGAAALALGARFDMFLPVLLGVVLGALVTDVPAVIAGTWTGWQFDRPWLRYVAASGLVVEAVLTLTLAGSRWG